MFDEENLISLATFLSFCLSVHNTYVHFLHYFFKKFSRNFHTLLFREIFALFLSRIFRIIFSQDFRIFSEIFAISISRTFRPFFAKQIEARKFAIFASERNAKMKPKTKFCEKCKIF